MSDDNTIKIVVDYYRDGLWECLVEWPQLDTDGFVSSSIAKVMEHIKLITRLGEDANLVVEVQTSPMAEQAFEDFVISRECCTAGYLEKLSDLFGGE